LKKLKIIGLETPVSNRKDNDAPLILTGITMRLFTNLK